MALLINTIKNTITVGKGKVFFREKGRNGYEDMLEVDDFKFNTSVEKIEKNSSREANVIQIASIIKSQKVTGSFSCVSPALEVMRFFGMADSVTAVNQSSGSLTWASYTAYLNCWINLNYVQLSSVKVRRATKLFDFVASETTDKITAVEHGLSNGDKLYFSNSGGTLPAPLEDGTLYYVINKTVNDFEVSLSLGGSKIDITSEGTGIHSAYKAYTRNIDYELLADAGWIFIIPGGGIANAENIEVSAFYSAQDMQEFLSATKSDIQGDIVFIGDAIAGQKQEFYAYVKLSPEGDFSMIGEDIQKFQINFEVLASEDVDGRRFLYRYKDRSGKSKTVAAI